MPLSTPADLANARDELLRLGPTARHNPRAMITYLRLLRELGVRDHESVLEYGSALIAKFRRKLSADEGTLNCVTMW
jgi:hypothetical protein